MAKTLQFKRYDSTTLATITGATGELIVDMNVDTLTVHDGILPGGYRLALLSEANTINIFTQSAFTQANAANISSQAAYNQSNTANLIANTAAANITILYGINTTQNTWIASNAAFTQSAFTLANSANILAQGAFTRANSAFDKANSANVIAQAAFNAANTGSSVLAQSSFNQANSANVLAQSAFNQANSANVLAQAAFNAANSASITFTQAAFTQANAANVLAQSAYNQGNTANLIANTAAANITVLFTNNTTQNTWISSNAAFTQSAYTFANTVNVFTQSAYTQANTATTGLATKVSTSGFTANTVLYSNNTGFVVSSTNLQLDTNGNLYGPSGTTSMSSGFHYIPSAAGIPTGVPPTLTGRVAMYYDSANNQFYVYNGTWKKVALT
jgi:hypothetical protein